MGGVRYHAVFVSFVVFLPIYHIIPLVSLALLFGRESDPG